MNRIERICTLLVVSILLAIVLVFGCLSDSLEVEGLKEGTVIEKTYKSSKVTFSGVYFPSYYQLHIQNYDENGKKQRCWINCSKEEYYQYEIGDYYTPKETENYALTKGECEK